MLLCRSRADCGVSAWYAERMDPLSSVAATFSLDAAQTAGLSRYVDLVLGWRAANVTALRSRADIVRVLIADSLALLDVPPLQGRVGAKWVDLGAGAGVPGVPLAVVQASADLTLLDSSAKKCAFLEEAVRVAGVASHSRVVCARSEQYAGRGQPGREAFSVVLARAVAPLPALVELAAPLLEIGGVLLASKTQRAVLEEEPAATVAATECGLVAGPLVPLPRSPLADAVCAVYEKTRPTPTRFPRRAGVAAKRPLSG